MGIGWSNRPAVHSQSRLKKLDSSLGKFKETRAAWGSLGAETLSQGATAPCLSAWSFSFIWSKHSGTEVNPPRKNPKVTQTDLAELPVRRKTIPWSSFPRLNSILKSLWAASGVQFPLETHGILLSFKPLVILGILYLPFSVKEVSMRNSPPESFSYLIPLKILKENQPFY